MSARFHHAGSIQARALVGPKRHIEFRSLDALEPSVETRLGREHRVDHAELGLLGGRQVLEDEPAVGLTNPTFVLHPSQQIIEILG